MRAFSIPSWSAYAKDIIMRIRMKEFNEFINAFIRAWPDV